MATTPEPARRSWLALRAGFLVVVVALAAMATSCVKQADEVLLRPSTQEAQQQPDQNDK